MKGNAQTMDNSENKREYRRLDVSINVEYDISTHQVWVESESKNISAGGICLLTRQSIKPGTYIKLKFKMPDTAQYVQVTGEIMWNQKYIINNEEYYDNGIKFVAINDRDRELIGKYIEGATFNSDYTAM
jgi:c-di-GMP-binding flagellar brake protein YcgR